MSGTGSAAKAIAAVCSGQSAAKAEVHGGFCRGNGGKEMAVPYNHHEVEKKWQAVWDGEKAFKTSEDFSRPKYYALVEFPYPSGQGLHVGHPRPLNFL